MFGQPFSVDWQTVGESFIALRCSARGQILCVMNFADAFFLLFCDVQLGVDILVMILAGAL